MSVTNDASGALRQFDAPRVAVSSARALSRTHHAPSTGAKAKPATGDIESAGAGAPPGSVDPRLVIWLSPSFPVGAFAYSHGLELAADRGWISNSADLLAWLADLVACGSMRNDMIVLAAAWRAVAASDFAALADANDLALALQPSAERRLETVTQGNAFLATLGAAWPADDLPAVARAVHADVAYPIAVGAGTAAHAVALGGVLQAYGIAFVTNLVSAAIRLSVVGQTDGQRALASLMGAVTDVAQGALSATLDDIGSATLRSDLASLAHETQYSRLFRS
ncbi:MAG: urease accessory protein UreF [Hyphomicrobiaceae bacterium]